MNDFNPMKQPYRADRVRKLADRIATAAIGAAVATAAGITAYYGLVIGNASPQREEIADKLRSANTIHIAATPDDLDRRISNELDDAGLGGLSEYRQRNIDQVKASVTSGEELSDGIWDYRVPDLNGDGTIGGER